MKRVILGLVLVAVGAVIGYKLVGQKQTPQPVTTTSSATAQAKLIFFLFHDPSDQDEGCRRIYAFADRAERELTGRVEVKRPDVKSEKSIVDKYQIRVLPTILVVSPAGAIEGRFEGEDKETVARIEQAFSQLKETK
jgi:thioredoxin-like negative regulator of GroEL